MKSSGDNLNQKSQEADIQDYVLFTSILDVEKKSETMIVLG